MLPGVEVRRRVDRAVVAEVQQRDGMDLEVQVVRRTFRVAGVADVRDHGSRAHARSVGRDRREP